MKEWREDLAALENLERDPIQPQYLARLVDWDAANDAILAPTPARSRRGRRDTSTFEEIGGSCCRGPCSMAPAVPYAIAAQVAYPQRQCIAFVGGGGFARLMAEFLTASRYGLPIKVVVVNNGELGQILWEQMVLGFPEYGVRFERRADFAPWARACGGFGAFVDKPGELDAAVREMLAEPGPALLDVAVKPDEPPMPPKVRYDYAQGFAEAFLKGQPRRVAIASTLFRDKLDQLGR
jgi:pyruvate dehydrogenase (quinone)